MTLDAAALKPDTDVRVQPETCHRSEAGPRPRLATNCAAHQDSIVSDDMAVHPHQTTALCCPGKPRHRLSAGDVGIPDPSLRKPIQGSLHDRKGGLQQNPVVQYLCRRRFNEGGEG